MATALRRLRQESGLSGNRLAARVAMSQSKISKIENGRLTPTMLDVDRILKALGAPPQVVDELLGLARLAHTHFHSVRSSLRRGLHHRQRDLSALEREAGIVRFFLPAMITGLLHIPEYARRSLGNVSGDLTPTISRRLERQKILNDETKRFVFLVTEAALRWALCPPATMAKQVDHVASMSRRPNIVIGVIPLGAEVPDTPLNTFTIYDARLVTAETIGGLIIMRDPRDVELHLESFFSFEQHAVCGLRADEIMRRIVDDFRARAGLQ
ncbi:MAG: helix-turn-helix domain-containing protein [Dactylosporangium sp.]|nr:helix-turn-helix domain-containing protein [Dactylosporangium sp.]